MKIDALRHRQALLRVLIFTFVTCIVWISFVLFRSQQTTKISPELLRKAEPLNPNINLSVINRIEQKRSFTTAELASFPINRIVRGQSGEDEVIRSVDPPIIPELTGDLSILASDSAQVATPSGDTQASPPPDLNPSASPIASPSPQ